MAANFKGWSADRVRDLQKEGKIRGFQDHRTDARNIEGGIKVAKHFKKKSKALDWIGWNLLYWANERTLQLEEEYKFHPERKWRFDYAIPSLKIAVEFNGGVFMTNGDHNSIKGITRDYDKINTAQGMGWRVIQLNAVNYKGLIFQLNQCLIK